MFNFSFNHVAISVKDVDESVHFYKKVFQLNEIKNTASDSKTRWFSLDKHIQIHLIPRPNLEVITNKAVHFALSITEISSFVEHLKSLNIDYSDWIGTSNKSYVRNDGILQIYFQDPDGYWIEINNDNNLMI